MAHPIYSDFTAGEISPRAAGRVELPLYSKACQEIENFIVLVEGGVERRPGTIYVADCDSHSAKSRLVAWDEPNDRQYFLEFCNAKLKIYRADTFTLVQTITSPTPPWSTAQLFDMSVAFDGYKTMFITHRSWKPCTLVHNSSTSDTDWTLSIAPTFTITNYADTNLFNATDHYPHLCFFFQTRLCFACSNVAPNYIWLSAAQNVKTGATRYTDFTLNTGTGALDESLGFAINAWASRGGTVRWLKGKETLVAGTTAGEIAFGNGERGLTPSYPGDAKNFSAFGGSACSAVAASAILFMQKGKKKLREIITDQNGNYVANDLTLLASHIAGASGFSTYIDYSSIPQPLIFVGREDGELAVMTYERALQILAWQRWATDGIIESVAVSTSATEVDAIWMIVQRTINGSTKRYIERMASRDWTNIEDAFYVDCGTAIDNGAEKVITGITRAKPAVVSCTAHGYSDGAKVKIRSTVGSVELNEQVYTVDSPAADSFSLHSEDDSEDIDTGVFLLTLDVDPSPGDFAPGATLTGDGAITATVVSKIDSKNYICRGCSATAGFTVGSSITDATNTAACTTPFPTCNFYVGLWTSGGTVQKIQKVVTGLTYLEAKELQVLGDGAVLPEVTVASGSVTLQEYVSKIAIGLPFESRLRPMPVEAGANEGTAQGRKKRIGKLVGRFYNSIGCKVGPDDDTLESLRFRDTDDPMTTATEPLSGDVECLFPGDYDTMGDLLVVQDEPLPLTLVAIMPKVVTYE